MRLSNRDRILDAAIQVTNRDGLTAVTFDTVAAEAGITRGGLIYHFASRDALLQAINAHLAARWEASLIQTAGKPFAQTTQIERYEAYVRGAAQSASRAEMLFLLEFSNHPELAAPWDDIIQRWAAPQPKPTDDAATLARFIARLAADGLWAHGFVSNLSMSTRARKGLIRSLVDMTRSEAAQAKQA